MEREEKSNRLYLTYVHSRNVFLRGEYKSFVRKFFKDVEFEGFEVGYYYPTISISGMVEAFRIEDLPKSYKPHAIHTANDFQEYLARHEIKIR
jgi:hypothetical protein